MHSHAYMPMNDVLIHGCFFFCFFYSTHLLEIHQDLPDFYLFFLGGGGVGEETG